MTPKRTFVISDLHLGGRPEEVAGAMPFQICHSYAELACFIRWVRLQAEDGPVELVINGDIVDFLAEDDEEGYPTAWDPSEIRVIRKLDRIVERTRTNQDGPFDALREFSSAHSRLVLILGNHDIELSLPRVRRHLVDLLTSPSGHVPTVVYDGEAYTTGRALIEHGNRYDDWNVVNHSGLREYRSILSRGSDQEAVFEPPAGSHLVVDVINRVKFTYRFIDLLKPERGAVVPLLMALMPSLRDPMAVVTGFAKNQLRSAWRRVDPAGQRGKLSSTQSISDIADIDNQAELQNLLVSYGFGEDATRLPSRVKLSSKTHAAPTVVAAKLANSKLRMGLDGDDAIIADFRDQFRLAFTSNTWDVEQENAEYLKGAQRILDSGEYDVVVFGHTHLPKRIELASSDGRAGTYLNTGTWADVIRVPDLGEGPQGIGPTRQFLRCLVDNDLESVRTRYLSYAEIVHSRDGTADAQVRSYCGPGQERSRILTEYPN